jgi:hypothetical protein
MRRPLAATSSSSSRCLAAVPTMATGLIDWTSRPRGTTRSGHLRNRQISPPPCTATCPPTRRAGVIDTAPGVAWGRRPLARSRPVGAHLGSILVFRYGTGPGQRPSQGSPRVIRPRPACASAEAPQGSTDVRRRKRARHRARRRGLFRRVYSGPKAVVAPRRGVVADRPGRLTGSHRHRSVTAGSARSAPAAGRRFPELTPILNDVMNPPASPCSRPGSRYARTTRTHVGEVPNRGREPAEFRRPHKRSALGDTEAGRGPRTGPDWQGRCDRWPDPTALANRQEGLSARKSAAALLAP